MIRRLFLLSNKIVRRLSVSVFNRLQESQHAQGGGPNMNRRLFLFSNKIVEFQSAFLASTLFANLTQCFAEKVQGSLKEGRNAGMSEFFREIKNPQKGVFLPKIPPPSPDLDSPPTTPAKHRGFWGGGGSPPKVLHKRASLVMLIGRSVPVVTIQGSRLV